MNATAMTSLICKRAVAAAVGTPAVTMPLGGTAAAPEDGATEGRAEVGSTWRLSAGGTVCP
jgi:hypothetical protein